MPRKPAAAPLRVTDPVTLVLKVTLLNVEPACWRRLVVDASMSLDRLHCVLQSAFGWHGGHLHEFWTSLRSRGGDFRRFGLPNEDDWDDSSALEDSTRARVAPLLGSRGAKLHYIYDFGDSWEHEIRCEKVIREGFDTLPVPPECLVAPPSPKAKRPRRIWAFCHDGAGRTPPEDCGGPGGYADLLAALADPTHEEHASFREWLGLEEGETWDAHRFDVDALNRELARMR